MNDEQVLKGIKMKSKIENMAHDKRDKNKQSEDVWLQTMSKEDRRKILLERLHKKTRRGLSQEDKFKELSEEIQRNPLTDNGVEQLTRDEIQQRNQMKKRKVKKLKQRILKKYPHGISDEVYFECLEKLKTLVEPQQKLYTETLISMYNNKKNKDKDTNENDLEF